jgi:hypothetical protein
LCIGGIVLGTAALLLRVASRRLRAGPGGAKQAPPRRDCVREEVIRLLEAHGIEFRDDAQVAP